MRISHVHSFRATLAAHNACLNVSLLPASVCFLLFSSNGSNRLICGSYLLELLLLICSMLYLILAWDTRSNKSSYGRMDPDCRGISVALPCLEIVLGSSVETFPSANGAWAQNWLLKADCGHALLRAWSDDLDLGLGKQLNADLNYESRVVCPWLLWAAEGVWCLQDSGELGEGEHSLCKGRWQLRQHRNSQGNVDRNMESECRLPNPSLGEGVEVFAHPHHAGLQRAGEQ